jgi:uncharacterized protein YndB with AHSA1/START domain
VRITATRELLAPREDVWAFVTQPHRLADWWPGVAAVEPDRRGVASGARWELRGSGQPSLVNRPGEATHLLVRRVEPQSLLAWHLTRGALDVELRLEDAGPRRTHATLTVQGSMLLGTRRDVARTAIGRLYDLCQTGAAP